jgi:CheY-like chemotaxis protein
MSCQRLFDFGRFGIRCAPELARASRPSVIKPEPTVDGAGHTVEPAPMMKRPYRIRIHGGNRGILTGGGEPLGARSRSTTVNPMTGMKTGPKTILLVEDDPQVREMGILVLRGGGYEVAAADSAAQAQKVWERHRGRIDLLFADMMIPNCSTGLELARRFRREKARLPVIITSGFGPEIAGDQAVELRGLTYLRKPFKAEELLRVVSRCVGGS